LQVLQFYYEVHENESVNMHNKLSCFFLVHSSNHITKTMLTLIILYLKGDDSDHMYEGLSVTIIEILAIKF
jgi:hypothetical protein